MYRWFKTSPLYGGLFRLSKYTAVDLETLKTNLRAHLFDGALFGFALSFVSVNTVFPVFIGRVGGSAIAVGSIPVLWTIGLNLPQAMLFRFTHTTGPIKPVVLHYALLYRISYLLIGLFTFIAVERVSIGLSVVLLLLLLFFTAVLGSVSTLPWFVLFTKTVPVTLRGKVLAVRQILSSFLGVFGGSLVGFILAVVPFPENFSLLYLVAFVFMMMSYDALTSLNEPVVGPAGHNIVSFRRFLAVARRSIKENKNLRSFLYADALTLMSMTVAVFFPVCALERFSLKAAYAGTFTVIFMGSMVVGNLFFGFLADSYGHKLNLMLLAGFSIAANVIAILADNILIYGLVFFFTAGAVALQVISRLSFIAELCAEHERSLYIALVNTVTAPSVLVGVLGGAAVNAFGYVPVFVFAMATGGGALWILYRYVEEPRVKFLKQYNASAFN
ncbi:MAG: MFS transporter [Bacteroidota bacterium]|nr:MFS transporter [Bacteroidota bacterium]